MVFFAFDHDAVMEALKRNWNQIAPKAMFSAAGNISDGITENLDALDTVKWNRKLTQDVADTYNGAGIGFQGTSELKPVDNIPGSNNKPVINAEGFVERFTPSDDKIIVPPGFDPIRGDNIL